MDTYYDVVVLGGGVGGYTAAIQAAKHHLKVALIEANLLGGVCLNQGCIPTKAYLKSAEVLRTVNKADDFGVHASTDHVDFAEIFQRKTQIVTQLRQGVTYLMQKNKITVYQGHGVLSGPTAVTVQTADGATTLTFGHLIVATGTTPKTLPNMAINDETIVTSEGMLAQEKLPESIVIIGGGAIGLEWASMLYDLGVKVQVLEYLDHLLGSEMPQAGKLLATALKRRGLPIQTEAKVLGAKETGAGVTIRYQEKDGTAQEITAAEVLVAVGRAPQTAGLNLTQYGVQLNANQTIQVDAQYQTTNPKIYAIGDCIDTYQLAHVAMSEGIHAADAIAGQNPEPLDYDQVPRCIYTYPELAVAGMPTIDKKAHPNIKTGRFPFTANGKALIEGETAGEIQVTRDTVTDDVLQVIMLGQHATDMIGEAGLGLYLNVSAKEIGQAVHPHPTLTEAVRQAAMDSYDGATDI